MHREAVVQAKLESRCICCLCLWLLWSDPFIMGPHTFSIHVPSPAKLMTVSLSGVDLYSCGHTCQMLSCLPVCVTVCYPSLPWLGECGMCVCRCQLIGSGCLPRGFFPTTPPLILWRSAGSSWTPTCSCCCKSSPCKVCSLLVLSCLMLRTFATK